MRIQCLVAACSVALLIGCGGESDSSNKPGTDKPAPNVSGPPADGATDNVVREAVKPGQSGHEPPKNPDAITKIIRQPLDSYLSAQDRIKQFQIKKQADLDELQNGPFKDADDYIARVLKPIGITLPALPAGQKYVYDAEQDQLMVERPE